VAVSLGSHAALAEVREPNISRPIDLRDLLPDESAIAAVTLAELAAGPHATESKDERARRQDRLQLIPTVSVCARYSNAINAMPVLEDLLA
jgi:predicted nucleic acid-binding protein